MPHVLHRRLELGQDEDAGHRKVAAVHDAYGTVAANTTD
jgi:hypothetical protein